MAKEKSKMGRLGGWQRLLARLIANQEDLPHLEGSRVRLAELLDQAQEAADRQAAHTAEKQEASKQLQAFLVEAGRLATVLEMSVKQHYGIRSEKLADFGLKPFRGRPRKVVFVQPPQSPQAPTPPAGPETGPA